MDLSSIHLEEFADRAIFALQEGERKRRQAEARGQIGALRERRSVHVVNDDAFQSLAVREALDDVSQLVPRTASERRLDDLLQAFGQNFSASFQVRTECALFRAHLMPRHQESDERDPHD